MSHAESKYLGLIETAFNEKGRILWSKNGSAAVVGEGFGMGALHQDPAVVVSEKKPTDNSIHYSIIIFRSDGSLPYNPYYPSSLDESGIQEVVVFIQLK